MKRSKRFDLNTLRLFIAVAERKSITSAATEMSLALGAASGRLKRLEQDLGTRLFHRSRKGIQLTDAGEMFLVHSRAVLDSIAALEGDMTLFAKGVRARIHLLANTAGLAEHLPRPLSRFLQTHPECDVAIEERASFAIGELLAAGAAELGIAVDWAVPSSLESFGFCTDRLVIITPRQHPLARRRRASFQEVVDLEFVGLGVDSALQNHIRSQAAKLGRTIRMRARVMGLDAVCQMVEAGVGIAIVPDTAARRAMASLNIARISVRDSWASRRLVVCAKSFKGLSKPARELAEHLQQSADGRSA